jgi:hypothetical protein
MSQKEGLFTHLVTVRKRGDIFGIDHSNFKVPSTFWSRKGLEF